MPYYPPRDILVLTNRCFSLKWENRIAIDIGQMAVIEAKARIYADMQSSIYYERQYYTPRRFFPGWVFDVGIVTDAEIQHFYDLWLRFKPHPSPKALFESKDIIHSLLKPAKLHIGIDRRVWLQLIQVW